MAFKDYSRIPASNQTIGDGLFIGPNMARNDVRDALQQLAADGKALVEDGIKGLKGDPADGPQTVDFDTTAGQLIYPATGDFSSVVTRDGTLGFEYDRNLLVFLNEQKLTPTIDYIAPGGVAPIVLTDDPGNGKLSVTSYASEGVGTGIERLYLVHTYREEGDTTERPAIRRARDDIKAAGGGTLYFSANQSIDGTSAYEWGEDTQNNDPNNAGNLCSNLIVRGDIGVTLRINRTDGPFGFFCNPIGNQRAVPVEPQFSNIQFVGLTFINDPTDTGTGYEENSAFCHLNAVENVTFDRCAFIGSCGDGVYIGAGDLGPDGEGERQNRYNRNIVFRDCFWDGINQNNRNAISIISGERIRTEGINRVRNWGKPGGVGVYDPYDPATGVGAPAGGVDVEPNAFTADPLVRDIDMTMYVSGSGAAGMAALLFNQDDWTYKAEGIHLRAIADDCRLGLFAWQADQNQNDRPLVKFSGIARNCQKPFDALQGPNCEVEAEFYDCPSPALLSYSENRRLNGFKLKAYFERCGSNGACLRVMGGKGLDLDVTFKDCPGIPLQIVNDDFNDPLTSQPYYTELSDSRFNLRQDPNSTVFPFLRVTVDTNFGTPVIDAGTVFDVGGLWRDENGDALSDHPLWAAREMVTKTVPMAYSWPSGATVFASPDLEEYAPASWTTSVANTPPEYPAWQVDRYKGGRQPFATADSTTVTATAFVRNEGQNVFTARRGNQSLYATASVASGAAREWIYSIPYSGSSGVYAGVSRAAAPVFDNTIADIPTRFANMDACLWMFDQIEGGEMYVLANATADSDPVGKAPIGGQVRIVWDGNATLTFFKRPGLTGSWTPVGIPKTLTSAPSSLRAFLVLANSSDTCQLVKQGNV